MRALLKEFLNVPSCKKQSLYVFGDTTSHIIAVCKSFHMHEILHASHILHLVLFSSIITFIIQDAQALKSCVFIHRFNEMPKVPVEKITGSEQVSVLLDLTSCRLMDMKILGTGGEVFLIGPVERRSG